MQFQVVQAPFRFGVEEGVDPHQVPHGTLVTAENVVWRKTGRVEKRFGLHAYETQAYDESGTSAQTTDTPGKRLVTRNSELCMLDGAYLWSYSSGDLVWRRRDRIPEVGLTWPTTLQDTTGGVARTDAAVYPAGSMLIQAWTTGDPTANTTGALYVQVIDYATGGTRLAPALLSASGNAAIRVLVLDTTAIVLAANGLNLAAYTINLSSLAVSTATNIITTMDVGELFDACVIGSDFVVAASEGGQISVTSFSSALAVVHAAVVVEANVPKMIAIDGSSADNIFVSYVKVLTVRYAVHNPTSLAQTQAPANVEVLASLPLQLGMCRYDSSNAIVAYTSDDTPGRTTTYKVSSGGVVDTNSERGTWGLRLQSKPAMIDGHCYAVCVDYPVQGGSGALFDGANTVLVEIETSSKGSLSSYVPHRYIGKIDVLVGGMTCNGTPPQIAAISATEYACPVPFLASAPAKTSVWRCGVRLVSLTVGDDVPVDSWRGVTYGGESYLTGALFSVYDGRSVFDYGFVRPPLLYSLNTASPAGAIATGQYIYAFHHEFRSLAGVLHRSPTTTLVPPNYGGATTQATFVFCSYNLTAKQDAATNFGTSSSLPMQIGAYRSTANGSVYHRLTLDPTYQVTTIDALAQTASLVDGVADADIGGTTALNTRSLIYTTGGILDDYQPPALVTQVLHRGRIFGIAGDLRTVWFSKSFQDDYGVAPGFHPNFRFTMDSEVTALGSMDEKLVIFGEDRIWFLPGDGPAANGLNSDYTSPIPIQTDVGCINPRSVVSTPDGIMFLSQRGLYLLTRGLELVWFGRSVVDQLEAFPNVTSAVIVPTQTHVRFTCNNDDGDAGITLVFDYVEKKWSVFKYVDGVAITDAALHDGVYTLLAADGTIYREDTTTYRDDGGWVTMLLVTAWQSSAVVAAGQNAPGPLSYHSVRRFSLEGVSNTNHDLSVWVGFDGESSYAQGPATWLAGTPVTTVGPLESCDVHIGTRRKCGSIRFKIQDGPPTSPEEWPITTGQGPSFDMMGIEIGVRSGFVKKPATKRS